MPLAFLLIFGGALLVYMGWKNESLPAILQDTNQPISGPAPTLDNANVSFPSNPSNPLFANPFAPPDKGTGSPNPLSPAGPLFGRLFGLMPKIQRRDQGRDLQVKPGQYVFAPGAGQVVAVKSNPGGFGAAYPIVHFLSGPWQGLTVYFGHIKSTVSPGQFVNFGTALGITQNGSGPYAGNATTPGWVEIGLAPGGNPGPFGQPLPPGL